MIICGVKVSHDGGIAVIDDGHLLFSIEIEKLANGLRYSSLGNLERVSQIPLSEGMKPSDVDQFVVDGWFVDGVDDTEVRDRSMIWARGGRRLEIPVAPYQDRMGSGGQLARHSFQDYNFSPSAEGYVSYHRVSNHLLGGYCSSPFAARGEDALVLVWDGGSVPRLYDVAAKTRTITPAADRAGCGLTGSQPFCIWTALRDCRLSTHLLIAPPVGFSHAMSSSAACPCSVTRARTLRAEAFSRMLPRPPGGGAPAISGPKGASTRQLPPIARARSWRSTGIRGA